jgi:hypothetical protein
LKTKQKNPETFGDNLILQGLMIPGQQINKAKKHDTKSKGQNLSASYKKTNITLNP